MRSRRAVSLLFAAVFFAAGASAQTLYKLIDKNGKITYSETRPKEFEGQVIPLEIDPSRNTATMPKFQAPANAPKGSGQPVPPSAQNRDAIAYARERVESARKALADARSNPGEGDMRHIGTAGGGTRPVPTPEYEKRIERLEEDVRKAEEHLTRLEQTR
jgi:hypothetical protein